MQMIQRLVNAEGLFGPPCWVSAIVSVVGIVLPASMTWAGRQDGAVWKIGTPIVTYYAGPPMTDATAQQMAEGGWNLVWCTEKELDNVFRHGLRAQLTDGLLTPQTLDDPARKAQLDALIARVRKHPALYDYYIVDEPNAAAFPAFGKLVAYLREKDPSHIAYINLFPTYANNDQLGTQGDTVTAYKEHLRQFVEVVKPDFISYDHYHFQTEGRDGNQYFLNLAMIRQSSLDAGVPFLNIVQACSWHPSMRIPNGDELRWLVYTSLAYGAQGISYYVYSHTGHNGAMATLEGTPTVLYHSASVLNREFAAIAAQVQPLRSMGAYHAGMIPPGAAPLPADAVFRLDPPVAPMEYTPPQPLQGMLLGCFGKKGKPTHALVVNLDYRQSVTTTVLGPKKLQVFDPATATWSPAVGAKAVVTLPPGGGKLLRVSNRR